MTEHSTVDTRALADYHEQRQGPVMTRSLGALAAVVFTLNTLFLPLDYWAFPEHMQLFFGARGALFAVLGVVYLKARFTHPMPAAFGSIFAMGAMLLTMIWADGGVVSKYSTGLVLMFCGIPVLLPLSVREMVAAVTPILAGYALMMLDGLGGNPIDQALHAFFPLAGAVVAVGSAALLEQIRLRDFQRCRELEQARDHLKEMDRTKARFTANIHHELRTPLTLTLAPLEAFLSGEFGDVSPLQRGYLKSMHSNALRLLKLINDLLDLAKIESRQLEVRRQPVKLDQIADRLVSGARPLAEQKGVDLSLVAAEVPIVHADPDAIEKIVMNLMGNALKFTDGGQRVEVRIEPHAAGVHVVVADTGLGIPADQLEHIFDRFAQVDSSSTRRFEGTGIGLSLAKELVELHGGRIWAASEGLGRGAQMHFTLPEGESDVEHSEGLLDLSNEQSEVAEDSASTRPAAERSARSLHSGKNADLAELKRSVVRALSSSGENPEDLPASRAPEDAPEVLIVEDNADMRQLLVYLIGQEFRVRVAKNGREGLERVREKLPDLVLTDVMMPEMSGTELCREIKSNPATSAIPVILVTSKAEREMKIEGLELGAEDYVTKPFHPRELMARVRALVRLHGLQEELALRNGLLEQTNAELRSTMAQLKETSARLAQSERLAAVGELAACIAHEVNNPINYSMNALRTLRVQLGDVQQLMQAFAAVDTRDTSHIEQQLAGIVKLMDELDHEELPPQMEELLAIAVDGLERTEKLVHDLHHFAAPGGGESAGVNLRTGVNSTLALMKHALRSGNVRVNLHLDEALPPLQGNQRSINQVFLNLFKNASEAMGSAGGTIDVSARLDGEHVVVAVRDDGPGIAAEVREQLFTPFFSTKSAGSGAGLGLSICRRMLEEFGGSIDVESTPGDGATFFVRLKAA